MARRGRERRREGEEGECRAKMVRREAERQRDEERRREDKSYERGKKKKITRRKEMRDKGRNCQRKHQKVSEWKRCVKLRVRMQTRARWRHQPLPLPAQTYILCRCKSNPGWKKSEQTEVTHIMLIITSARVSALKRINLVMAKLNFKEHCDSKGFHF